MTSYCFLIFVQVIVATYELIHYDMGVFRQILLYLENTAVI